jgi:phosphatidylserine/phosphatidylglycerophosphate/cardiolipin synthase-like enzyme
LSRLIRSLVRHYRGTLFVILLAMLVQTVMGVAAPWPLKIILDNVVGSHKLHAKMLLADHVRAIVGSINLAPGSFDSRRELAIEVRDGEVVDRLQEIAHHDWKHSHSLDLSDEGLLAEFKNHQTKGTEELALRGSDEHEQDK